MRARYRRLLPIFGIFFLLIVIFVIWFDWNMIKPYAERQVSEKTGREFTIRGDLNVSLSLNPLISAEGISLANAEWGTEQPMLDIGKASFRVSLWDLIRGDVVLPEVSVSRPRILLEKSADGKRNWDLKKPEEEVEPPKIGSLALEDGKLIFRDPKTKTDVHVTIFTESGVDAREMPLNVTAEGTYADLAFTAQALGGQLTSLTDKTAAYPVKARVEIGTTRATAEGTITGLQELASMDLKLDIQGDDMSTLYPIAGIVFFPSPPYEISGNLTHQKTEWSMKGFSGTVGKSDMGGDLIFDTGGERPILRGDVISKVLDLTDLSGVIGARKAPQPQDSPQEKKEKEASIEAQKDRLLPDQEFRVDRLRAMDADVKFTGESIRNKELPVEHVHTHLKVDNGLMTINPLNFAVAGGNIVGSVMINGREEIPSAEAKIDLKRLQLKKLFPKMELTHGSAGLIGGATNIKAHGKSVGGLLGSADGRFSLIMSGGQISNMMLEIIGLDAGEVIKFLFTGDKNVPVRCAVIDFGIKKGIMATETFVIDTTDTNILGEGQLSLLEETLQMKLSPEPKDFSILSLRTPVHITGTLKHPKVYPDKMLAIRVGAAVVLGALATPLAALIPTIETGPGEDNDCKALIASTQQPLKGKQKKAEGTKPDGKKPDGKKPVFKKPSDKTTGRDATVSTGHEAGK
jgi:AsmA family protein